MAQKTLGKLHYFGTWSEPDGAVAKYLDQRDDLQAGRKLREATGGATVRDLINRFLSAKRQLVDNRELSPRSFAGNHATCLRVADAFGPTRTVSDLRADDFESLRAGLAKGRGPVALGNEVRHVRILFKYGHDAGIVDAPVRMGPQVKEPSKRALRHARHAAGPRLFEADEPRSILAETGGQLRAMILLGINAGFGQTDCATLPPKAIDLESGWIDFLRPKTAVRRRVPLWPETAAASSEALPGRPAAKNPADAALSFLTRQGRPWVRMPPSASAGPGRPEWTPVDSVGLMFGRLLTDLGVKRPGVSFYALRHTFETIAGRAGIRPPSTP